jgi:hypothetical protein
MERRRALRSMARANSDTTTASGLLVVVLLLQKKNAGIP